MNEFLDSDELRRWAPHVLLGLAITTLGSLLLTPSGPWALLHIAALAMLTGMSGLFIGIVAGDHETH